MRHVEESCGLCKDMLDSKNNLALFYCLKCVKEKEADKRLSFFAGL